jgi:hypothetical protein
LQVAHRSTGKTSQLHRHLGVAGRTWCAGELEVTHTCWISLGATAIMLALLQSGCSQRDTTTVQHARGIRSPHRYHVPQTEGRPHRQGKPAMN